LFTHHYSTLQTRGVYAHWRLHSKRKTFHKGATFKTSGEQSSFRHAEVFCEAKNAPNSFSAGSQLGAYVLPIAHTTPRLWCLDLFPPLKNFLWAPITVSNIAVFHIFTGILICKFANSKNTVKLIKYRVVKRLQNGSILSILITLLQIHFSLFRATPYRNFHRLCAP